MLSSSNEVTTLPLHTVVFSAFYFTLQYCLIGTLWVT